MTRLHQPVRYRVDLRPPLVEESERLLAGVLVTVTQVTPPQHVLAPGELLWRRHFSYKRARIPRQNAQVKETSRPVTAVLLAILSPSFLRLKVIRVFLQQPTEVVVISQISEPALGVGIFYELFERLI